MKNEDLEKVKEVISKASFASGFFVSKNEISLTIEMMCSEEQKKVFISNLLNNDSTKEDNFFGSQKHSYKMSSLDRLKQRNKRLYGL